MRSEVNDKEVTSTVVAYSLLIPVYLNKIKFYESRKDIVLGKGEYQGMGLDDPFHVEMVEGLPLQTNRCVLILCVLICLILSAFSYSPFFSLIEVIAVFLWHHLRSISLRASSFR